MAEFPILSKELVELGLALLEVFRHLIRVLDECREQGSEITFASVSSASMRSSSTSLSLSRRSMSICSYSR